MNFKGNDAVLRTSPNETLLTKDGLAWNHGSDAHEKALRPYVTTFVRRIYATVCSFLSYSKVIPIPEFSNSVWFWFHSANNFAVLMRFQY